MNDKTADVLIVGAGVIGLGLADTLVRREISVLVLERERAGGRASWAGAGMLNCRPHRKHKEGATDFGDLALASMKLHEQWAARLLEETEIDVGYRRCGALEIYTHERIQEDGAGIVSEMLDGCASRGVRAEKLTPRQAKELEPALDIGPVECAVHLLEDAQIRPPRFSRALALSVRQREGRIKEGVAIKDVIVENGRAVAVETSDGTRYSAGRIVFCTGSWTGQFRTLTDAAPPAAKIEPVRGQIVCYQTQNPLTPRLLTCGERYLVLRSDGVVLVGSTTERVGFEAVTTPEGQAALRQFGASLVPALKTLEPLQGWADLRPGLKGRHPLLGPVPGIENLFVAAGHYRNGLLLAPITAEVMAPLLLGEKPPLPITWYFPKPAANASARA